MKTKIVLILLYLNVYGSNRAYCNSNANSKTFITEVNKVYLKKSEQSHSKTSDSYLVSFSDKNKKVVKVEAHITLVDSVLVMSSSGPVPERWPEYIRGLIVYNKKGEKITVNRKGTTSWGLDNNYINKQVKLIYEVHLNHEDINWPGGIDGVAFVRDWGIMVTGRSIFLQNGNEKKDIKVTFDKPKHWKVSTPWKKYYKKNNTFIVPNRIQLEESFMFAGMHEELKIVRNDFNLKFVLGGALIIKDKKKYSDVANGLLDYYIKLMGGVPKPKPGDELSEVMVMINQSDKIDGEVIGNHISLFINPKVDLKKQVTGWYIYAHEFFHLWNGKSLRFTNTTTDWFSEGITNYYAFKGLFHTKLIDEEGIRMVMSKLLYQRYVNDAKFGKLAPAYAASGFDKDNHWGIVYGGGFFAGVGIDMKIRYNSKNENSLDKLMQSFYQEYAGTNYTISNKDILNRINSLSNFDFSDFMKSHITGSNPVEISKYFIHAGIDVSTEKNQLHLRHKKNKNLLQQKIWLGFLGSD